MGNILDTVQQFRKSPQHRDETNNIDRPDSDWLIDTLMIKSTLLNDLDAKNRYWSITNLKITDTSLGGNISINSYPQFTRYADIRSKGRIHTRNDTKVNDLNGNLGMGRYYGEAIDDNSINVYLTFGVPSFNNIFNFLFSAVDYKSSVIANTGRSPIAYDIGFGLGRLALFVAFPIATTLIWIGKSLYKVFAAPGKLSYYYMKPTMPTYWSTVNSLVTMMATELGIVAPIVAKDPKEPDKIGAPVVLDREDLEFMHKYMPDIMSDKNYIDVPAIVLKTQRAANREFMEEQRLIESGRLNKDNFLGLLMKNNRPDHKTPVNGLTEKLNKMLMTADYFYGKKKEEYQASTEETKEAVKSIATGADGGTNTLDEKGRISIPDGEEDKESNKNKFFEFLDSEVREGSRFLVLRVDDPGQVSESFNNNETDIGLESGLNSINNKVRSFKFNLGGGNVIPGVDTVAGYVKDTIAGTLDGVTMGLSSILGYLLGDANIDMPKRWESSTASFPETSFKMKLIAPYNNPISQLQNIYIPLACLLAGALPRATGTNSYASPFLTSMFIRGHQTIELGMIKSLSITRGTSNLSFSKQSRPLAIDVSFTVVDFSKIISVPTGTSLEDPISIMYDDSQPLNRYISALCGRDLRTSIYLGSKMKIKVSRFIAQTEAITSPAYWGMKVGNMVPDIFKSPLRREAVNYTETYK